MTEPEPHTQLLPTINTDSAIIMGDPARVERSKKFLEDVEDWAFNREYKSILGTYQGKRILVMSTGI
ncbi:nucleoside phosphorylase, partial [Levilactobacillus parabrevis]|nr:nucleoside phosphorylase [Levilactobacillus parabrevis]